MHSMLFDILSIEFPSLPRVLSPTARIRDDLCLDSMDLVRLIIALEDRLGIRFDPGSQDLAAVFVTVGSLDAFLGAQMREQERGHG